MRKVLFDTDIGSDCDDAVALGLLLASPELELVAVTTVSSDTRTRGRIAASLLALAGRSGVDVCAGSEGGLARPRDRYNWFGHEPDCVADVAHPPLSAEPAPERIARAVRETPDLEIVMVGPMTNLALALALDPELPRRAGGVTIMGGHVREAKIGDFVCPFGVDYNLCSDPEAAVAVLGAGFRTTLVTADVTLQTWLRAADLERLEAAGPLPRELARQVRMWEPVQRDIFSRMGGDVAAENVAFLHDPLTVLSICDEEPLHFEVLHVLPTIRDGVLRTHEVDPASRLGAPMRVATGVDAALARDRIVERLLSSGSP